MSCNGTSCTFSWGGLGVGQSSNNATNILQGATNTIQVTVNGSQLQYGAAPSNYGHISTSTRAASKPSAPAIKPRDNSTAMSVARVVGVTLAKGSALARAGATPPPLQPRVSNITIKGTLRSMGNGCLEGALVMTGTAWAKHGFIYKSLATEEFATEAGWSCLGGGFDGGALYLISGGQDMELVPMQDIRDGLMQ